MKSRRPASLTWLACRPRPNRNAGSMRRRKAATTAGRCQKHELPLSHASANSGRSMAPGEAATTAGRRQKHGARLEEEIFRATLKAMLPWGCESCTPNRTTVEGGTRPGPTLSASFHNQHDGLAVVIAGGKGGIRRQRVVQRGQADDPVVGFCVELPGKIVPRLAKRHIHVFRRR